MRVRIAVVAMVLAGCGTPPPEAFSRAGATYQDYLNDRYACILDSRAADSSLNANIFDTCMATKGYHQDPVNGFTPPPGALVTSYRR